MSFYTTSGIPISKWVSIKTTIPASSTLDVETIVFNSILRGIYEVVIYSDAENKYKSFTANVSRRGSLVSDTVSAKLGDNIQVNTSFIQSGADLILRMQNNESYDVDVSLETLKVRR